MRTAIILGGTKGLGLALAAEAAARGVQPVIVGRSQPRAIPHGAITLSGDLADPLAVLPRIRARYGEAEMLFWVAGLWLKKPVSGTTLDDEVRMTALQIAGFERALALFHAHRVRHVRLPYRLTVVASTSAHIVREDEALYCGVKAFQHHYTKCFGVELLRDLPGSQVTLVCPGGMRTELFSSIPRDVSAFMDPAAVARIIWEHVTRSAPPLLELIIKRTQRGEPDPSTVDWTPEARELVPVLGIPDPPRA